MERRNFLKFFSLGTVAAMGTHLVWRNKFAPASALPEFQQTAYEDLHHDMLEEVFEDMATNPTELIESIRYMSTPAPDSVRWLEAFKVDGNQEMQLVERQNTIETYLEKMQNFEDSHLDDVYLEHDKYTLLVRVFKRIDRVQSLVGHGNFNVISFDEMRKIGKRYSAVGEFSRDELDFVEAMFAGSARRYGFFGDKVTTSLTASITKRERVKVKHTGHFLFRGEAQTFYDKLKSDVGDSIILTSGIRSIVKQTHLFLAKTIQSEGNLSRASRSLAPPGHSFHGVGDFDVGKIGFGPKNFTTDFADTREFKKLVDLGYVDMRYPEDNMLGVRYEPWHIKVV